MERQHQGRSGPLHQWFENVEGKLLGEQSGAWKVDFYGSSASELKRDGNLASPPATTSRRKSSTAHIPVPEGAPIGASFERALYSAYMGGSWKIVSGRVKATPCSSRPTARSPACRR
jgi:hypothetical protein